MGATHPLHHRLHQLLAEVEQQVAVLRRRRDDNFFSSDFFHNMLLLLPARGFLPNCVQQLSNVRCISLHFAGVAGNTFGHKKITISFGVIDSGVCSWYPSAAPPTTFVFSSSPHCVTRHNYHYIVIAITIMLLGGTKLPEYIIYSSHFENGLWPLINYVADFRTQADFFVQSFLHFSFGSLSIP